MRRLLPLVLLALSGCVATQRDILDLSQQNDTISLQVQGLKKVMTQLQANQADLNARLEDMHKDMSVLNETLKDNQQSTARLSTKMDDLGAALSGKVSQVQRGIDLTQEALKREEERRKQEAAETERRAGEDAARRKADAEAKARVEAAEAAEAAAKAAAAAVKPSDIYQDARRQLDRKEYDAAAQGFALYLERSPKGESADLAAYNLGQARFYQERWEDAARSFAVALDRYPKSELTAASRLRYAQSLLRMKGHADEAKRYLESIPQDFPKAPEAIKARELLKSLNGKK
ncbi:MAG: tetratricopeptide repeat protein [Elusimicrobia bacterium]|nr:tetratricopeptide repeat protein [Elusimicrobiota bacterium]